MNPQNGQVLALASFPSYDLNEWVGGISSANFTALQASGAENDEAIEGLYTPGSTFKLVTATAALQDGLITPSFTYDDTGTFKIDGCPSPGVVSDTGCVLHDDPGDSGGVYNVTGALTVSSDSFFYKMGELFYEQQSKYGTTPIQNEATAYGEGTITGIDLPGEAQGWIDSYLTRAKLHAEAPKGFPYAPMWHTGDNIEMAFGQGETVLTPIEQAVAYSTFANGGRRYRARGGVGDRRPDHGQGHQEDRAPADGHRRYLARQLLGHAPGIRGRGLEPARHRVPGLPGLPGRVEPGREDGHGLEPVGPGAQQLVRRLRPQPEPAVPRACRDRPGRVRRRRGGSPGAQHLQLHRGEPGPDRFRAVKTPTPAAPPSLAAPATNAPLGTPTTPTTTKPGTPASPTTTPSTAGGG